MASLADTRNYDQEVEAVSPWKKLWSRGKKSAYSGRMVAGIIGLIPLLAILIATLSSFGSNDWDFPAFNVDNPLRYDQAGFWASSVIAPFFYGVMLYMLWNKAQTRRRSRLWFILALPVIFFAVYIGLQYGAQNDAVPAAYLGFTTVATLLVALAAVAGTSDMPEVVFWASPFALWALYETSLAAREAGYVAPAP